MIFSRLSFFCTKNPNPFLFCKASRGTRCSALSNASTRSKLLAGSRNQKPLLRFLGEASCQVPFSKCLSNEIYQPCGSVCSRTIANVCTRCFLLKVKLSFGVELSGFLASQMGALHLIPHLAVQPVLTSEA